uniref:zinc finger MYM-type protein 5-like n=1 Tax=Fragaria vesca subsp. vesca TaxID=101020 RepID=UPI0005C9C4CF|nr:PREDICTED: zinc finger MYM-type protein 5-like [Fragaria vesca subsp. vesca]
MEKFVFKKGKQPQCPVDVDVDVDVDLEENVDVDVNVGLEENVEQPMEEPLEEDVDVNVEETMEPGLEGNDDIPLNIFDPKNWDNLAPKWRDLLVKRGPVRDLLTGKGPRDGSKRCFSSEFYTKYLSNGEKHHRDWLVYCKDLDRVFCFCCKVFKTKRQPTQLAHDGIRDWGHLSHSLKAHEKSSDHIDHMLIWVELRIRLETNQVIDKVLRSNQKRD